MMKFYTIIFASIDAIDGNDTWSQTMDEAAVL